MVDQESLQVRMARVGDAEVLAEQRVRMFEDSGQSDATAMERMRVRFVDWVRPRLEDGRYVGWLVEDAGTVVAGAGMWIMDFPPHFLDAKPARAYLLNFYVAPEQRGKRLAGKLLDLAVVEARRLGIKVVSLHASKYGRPVYERYGFVPSNEMLLLN